MIGRIPAKLDITVCGNVVKDLRLLQKHFSKNERCKDISQTVLETKHVRFGPLLLPTTPVILGDAEKLISVGRKH